MRAGAWFPLLVAVVLAEGAVQAEELKSSYFLVELSSGLAEPAYSHGDLSLSYGLTGGMTFKASNFPVRFYLLTTLIGRNGHADGSASGAVFSSDRHDVDLYWSLRLVFPVIAQFRLYAEGGLGHRWSFVSLRRSNDLPPLEARDSGLVGVLAVGAQYRVMQNLSLGLRAELVPTTADGIDPVSRVTGADLTPNRFTVMAQVGFHF